MGTEPEGETDKFQTTLTPEDEKWLKDNYPGALSTSERIRMAISDARLLREIHQGIE